MQQLRRDEKKIKDYFTKNYLIPLDEKNKAKKKYIFFYIYRYFFHKILEREKKRRKSKIEALLISPKINTY